MSDSGKRTLRDISSPTTSPSPKRHEPSSSATRRMSPSSAVNPPVASVSPDSAARDDPSEFDQLIVDNFQTDDPLSKTMAPYLLHAIVTHASDRLDSKFTNVSEAQKLIADKPELFDLLKSSWRAKTFGSILALPILQTSRSLVSSPPRPSELLNANIHKNVVSSAWDTEYVGHYHHILLNNINRMSREAPYSNSVAILQSSGTGKSRMVREQSDLVFTLPFNLRLEAETKDVAYPPPDTAIRNYLCWPLPNLEEYQTRYLHLLGHLFRAVAVELNSLYGSKEPTYGALAKSWRRYMEMGHNRARIYEQAVERCSSDDLKELQEKYPRPEWSSESTSMYAASQMANEDAKQLLQRIDDCCETMEGIQDNHVKLMLYFDEAHVLAQKVPHDLYEKDMYDALCSCFNVLLAHRIFVIYLSTNSNISHLAPQGSLARSARARANPEVLQAPVTETPFDCSSWFPITPGTLKLEDVCKVEFMAQFGRPMFWSLLASAGHHKSQILPVIIALARAKLICHHNILQTHARLPPAATSAVLDVLLSLDFEPRRQAARSREAELVASHMRIAFSVPQDREYFRTGYPSEPLLAEAAAQQMEEFQRASRRDNLMAEILESEFKSGLLDQGQRGEVVFRLLLSSAYRRAVIQDHPDESLRNFSKGCKLTTLIKHLFSTAYADEILNSVPDNVKSSTTFASAFEDAIVRFTHFGKMADDTGTTSYAMFAAFVRCMAIICWSSQNDVDVLIPVLLKPEKILEESVMSGLLIQVKRRKRTGQYAIDQKAIDFFPTSTEGEQGARPYITLVAELGVQLPIPPEASTKAKVRREIIASAPNPPTEASQATKSLGFPSTPSRLRIAPQPELIAHPRDVHARYSIFAYGCSNTVYGVISQSDKSIYKFLLGSGDFLAEHPRRDADSLRAVRTMKPFWSAGLECYHWIEVPFLQMHQVSSDGDGWLSVGQYDEGVIRETV